VVYIPVMLPAERYGELIADLAAEGARLGKPNVVGFCRPSATKDARLRCDMPQMLLVADAAWLVEGQDALVDRGTLKSSISRGTCRLTGLRRS
jgi:hypothetical protein